MARELLNNRRAANNCGVKSGEAVCAKDGKDTPIMLAHIVNRLNQRVHAYFIFVVTMVLTAGCAQRVAFINNQESTALARSDRPGNVFESLGN